MIVKGEKVGYNQRHCSTGVQVASRLSDESARGSK
jgi:hypothetical protein